MSRAGERPGVADAQDGAARTGGVSGYLREAVRSLRPQLDRRALGREAAWVLGSFVVLGVVGGVVWWQLVTPAAWTRTADDATMDEVALGHAIDADGWFLLIAAVGGLVAGFVLTAWRRRDPVVTVVLVAVGAGLASAVMWLVGHTLGPGPYQEALREAAVGDRVPVPLDVHAHGIFLVWPFTALFTAVAVLWGTKDPEPDVSPPSA